MKTIIENLKKVTPFYMERSVGDLKKGNHTKKGSCVKATPTELAVLTTHLKGISKG
jgi:hypothetical protein